MSLTACNVLTQEGREINTDFLSQKAQKQTFPRESQIFHIPSPSLPFKGKKRQLKLFLCAGELNEWETLEGPSLREERDLLLVYSKRLNFLQI